MERNRIRDFGIVPGRLETGKRNKITDVPGVKVGHCTVKTEENHTGITVIVPGADNAFAQKYTAAAYVHNGFGKSAGLVQVEELGTLETPIALTNTLNVGKVWDAMVDIVVEQCEQDGLEPMSINPVVGECNDSRINQIQKRVVGADEVRQAFASASEEFEEGDVGAGAGTICYGLKGGIGSASRVIRIGEKEYTIGVLVQSNFGATEDFVLNGESVGAKILDWKQEKDDMAASEEDKGSIMSILATDLPLTSRQLRRILRRTGVGIARTGGYTGTWKRRGHDRVYHSEPDSVRSRGRTAADSGNSGTCDQPGFPCGCRGRAGGYFKFHDGSRADPRTGGRTLLQFVRVPGRSGFETVTNLCRQSTETV